MIIITFAASPEHVGNALGLIPQLCTVKERWSDLYQALYAARGNLGKVQPGKQSTTEAAQALVDSTTTSVKATFSTQIDIVTFSLPYGQTIAIYPHAEVRGHLMVLARVSERRVSWFAGSLVADGVAFSVSPTGKGEAREADDSPLSPAPKAILTRMVLDDLNKKYEHPPSLAEFYELVFPHLPQLLLFAAAYLAISDKWYRRDWLMDSIIAHVQKVIAEVKVNLEEKRTSVFPWLP